jgi:hypothetical protein
MVSTCAVDRVLDPPRAIHSIRNFADGPPITIEGILYREPEHETYGSRLYVAIERAAKQGGALDAVSGTARIAVIGGGSFRLEATKSGSRQKFVSRASTAIPASSTSPR